MLYVVKILTFKINTTEDLLINYLNILMKFYLSGAVNDYLLHTTLQFANLLKSKQLNSYKTCFWSWNLHNSIHNSPITAIISILHNVRWLNVVLYKYF